MPFLPDTNIAIHFARGSLVWQRVEAQYHLLTSPDRPVVSVVTVAEVHAFAAEFAWGARKLRQIDFLLTALDVVPIPYPGLIDAYVQVSEFSRKAGRVLGKNDLWIAATAAVTGATLLTTDKDFDHLAPLFLSRVWVDPAL